SREFYFGPNQPSIGRALPPAFYSGTTYPVGENADDLAGGDFNGDGSTDLAVLHETNNGNVLILLGDGQGDFIKGGYSNSWTNPAAVAAGDFDGDGKDDLVVADAGGKSVSIIFGNAAKVFVSSENLFLNQKPSDVLVDDFNGDGLPDFAVSGDW